MNLPKAIILDDEPGITSLCERILSGEGFETRSYTDPRKALESLTGTPADILLVDIRMPVMSGFEVIAEVRRQQPDMAILVMTGYGTVETAIRALHEGVDGLLLKPFEKKELVDAVQRALVDKQKKRDSARVQILRPLFDETESLLAETRFDHLLQYIVDSISRLLHCPHAGFYRLENESTLQRLSARGKHPEDASGISKMMAQAYESDTPILINAFKPGDENEQIDIAAIGYGAMLVVPIRRMNIKGVIFAGRDKDGDPFTDSDLESSVIFSRQAAIALENALLYNDLRDYIKRVEESQAALVQAEKLATAGRMTASIAHEINNPLQSVQNCLHLAARKDLPPETREKYFEMTNSELDRLMVTVQRMLDFYRPNAEREQVNIIDILDHVLELLHSQLSDRNIRVTSSWPAAAPKVNVVKNQIQQVFINIILNAYDAMPDGGELLINVGLKEDNVVVEFKDTGPGVPEEFLPSLFEPFSSTKDNGSGLGLSVSYGIVSAHGGYLEYVGGNEQGAIFRVILPVSKA